MLCLIVSKNNLLVLNKKILKQISIFTQQLKSKCTYKFFSNEKTRAKNEYLSHIVLK